ncbi:MAG: site-2 protease family protein [Gaiellaceae bacterium]|jgi:Zn-dependent protease
MTSNDPYRKWQGLEEEQPRFEPLDFSPVPYEPVTEPARDYKPIHPEGALRSFFRKLAAPFVALGALLVKFKAAILLVFKLKLFATAATMVVSIGAYTMLWGWRFAVGFVLLLLVHECGHALEARHQGLPTGAPTFIPFMGAVILLKEMPHNVWNEAKMALAGPIFGSLGALACWGLAIELHSDLLRALAYFGFFLNLFNLLPIVPLDGGRVAAALHPAIWFVGLAALLALVIVTPNPILLIILVIAAFDLYHRWSMRHQHREQEYYKVTAGQRFAVAVGYFGMAILLTVAMAQTHIVRHF